MSAGDVYKNPAYKIKWVGKSVHIIYDGTPIARLYLGHGTIDADQLLAYLNAAYLEGYMQKERELGIETSFNLENKS